LSSTLRCYRSLAAILLILSEHASSKKIRELK
jgi:hypothetical protein